MKIKILAVVSVILIVLTIVFFVQGRGIKAKNFQLNQKNTDYLNYYDKSKKMLASKFSEYQATKPYTKGKSLTVHEDYSEKLSKLDSEIRTISQEQVQKTLEQEKLKAEIEKNKGANKNNNFATILSFIGAVIASLSSIVVALINKKSKG